MILTITIDTAYSSDEAIAELEKETEVFAESLTLFKYKKLTIDKQNGNKELFLNSINIHP